MIANRHRIALVAALAAVPFSVLACSSPDKSGASQPASAGSGASAGPADSAGKAKVGSDGFPDSCSLLSPDDAKTALGGEAVDPGQAVPLRSGGGTCTFAANADGKSDDVVVQIGKVDVIRQTASSHKTQAVSGIGDEALLYGMGGDIYNIFVRKGSTGVDINIAKDVKAYDEEALPPRPVADALQTLAKTALGHL